MGMEIDQDVNRMTPIPIGIDFLQRLWSIVIEYSNTRLMTHAYHLIYNDF